MIVHAEPGPRKVKLRPLGHVTLLPVPDGSGSNPAWRTWRGALATPVHSAAGVGVAAWPPTPAQPSIPANPPAPKSPGNLRGSRPLEVRQREATTAGLGSPCLYLHLLLLVVSSTCLSFTRGQKASVCTNILTCTILSRLFSVL